MSDFQTIPFPTTLRLSGLRLSAKSATIKKVHDFATMTEPPFFRDGGSAAFYLVIWKKVSGWLFWQIVGGSMCGKVYF